MSNYDNTNRGQAWGNDKKERDSQPDFKGSINVEGKEYWFSMWKRKAGAHPNAPAVSFSVTSKEDVQAEGKAKAQKAVSPQVDDFDDDIPF